MMTHDRDRLVGLTRFAFGVPTWPTSVAFALLGAAAAGGFGVEGLSIVARIETGTLVFGVPTLVAIVTTAGLARLTDTPLNFDRAGFLSMVCEWGIVLVFVIIVGIAHSFAVSSQTVFESIVVLLALAFAFRLFIERLLFGNSRWAATVSAAVQPLGIGMLLIVVGRSVPRLNPPSSTLINPVGFLVGTAMVYGVLTMGLLLALEYPLRRKLGVRLSAFVPALVSYLSGDASDLESFFADVGEDVVVPVTVLSFRAPDGPERARFVLPAVHPGPMENVGGGKLPYRLAEAADCLTFPCHSMTTHDFDLATEAGVEAVVDAAQQATNAVDLTETSTAALTCKIDGVRMLGQAFGDNVLLTTSFSSPPADDVKFGVGRLTDTEVRAAGFDDAFVADAHNCHPGSNGEDVVTVGSRRARNLVRVTGRVANEVDAAEQGSIELGVAQSATPWDVDDGIGPLGVRVALVHVQGQMTAYVLVDGNNLVPGLRDRVLKQLSSADAAEILTTDTHAVNRLTSTNRVGDELDEEAFVDLVVQLAEEAQKNLDSVEAGMATTHTRVRVFGDGRTARFAAIGSLVSSVGRNLLFLAVGAVVITTLTFFHLFLFEP